MPDVLEMPYRPDVFLVESSKSEVPSAKAPCVTLEGETYLPASDPSSSISHPPSAISYRLGGPTCLAGDVTGDFAFPRPLEVGDLLVFDDMAHYTMVKTTTFNGVPHPSIVLQHEDGRLETIREFSYADFRDRLS
jgi:carboxynorspermidine decarboxylase